MNQDKRRFRRLKRDIKRAGQRKLRRHLQGELREHPEEAGQSEVDFGRCGTAWFNGNDHDATRLRKDDSAAEPRP